ncbi:MAG: arginase family protein [Alphaproteobacteria bacterium]
MSDELTPDDELMLSSLYWWGIPSLFRCPIISDPADCDIALVGVPHSTGNGTTERDQHLGPRAVRDVSAWSRRVHVPFMLDPWEACRVADLGDVPLPEANDNEKCIERITSFYGKIDASGVRPVSIGGDHSITGGILQALGGEHGKLSGGREVALLHFDAHTDAFEQIPHFLGAYKSAAHWAAYLVRGGHVDATCSTQVGIRGNPRTLDWTKTSSDLGYEVIDIDRYREIGPQAVVEIVRRRVGDMPLYITLDLDCFDTTVAPGVANLEVGTEGLWQRDVLHILRGMRGLDIIGGDVVCLMPTKDQANKMTAHLSAAMMFEMICLIADGQRTG